MSSPAAVPFAAALLAGGRSTRMGRDKASLEFGGRPLWQRQLALLRALEPAELFISARPEAVFPAAGATIVPDAVADGGPLGGIAALLARSSAPRLLVLAVDLPMMPAAFLRRLVEFAAGGVVPLAGDRFEPLAAVYPAEARELAEVHLRGEDRALQPWVRELMRRGLAVPFPIEESARAFFTNVNTPAEAIAAGGAFSGPR